jgi:hypothetical protein
MASLHKDNEQRNEEMCRGMEEMRQAIRQDLGELAQSMRCDDRRPSPRSTCEDSRAARLRTRSSRPTSGSTISAPNRCVTRAVAPTAESSSALLRHSPAYSPTSRPPERFLEAHAADSSEAPARQVLLTMEWSEPERTT